MKLKELDSLELLKDATIRVISGGMKKHQHTIKHDEVYDTSKYNVRYNNQLNK